MMNKLVRKIVKDLPYPCRTASLLRKDMRCMSMLVNIGLAEYQVQKGYITGGTTKQQT